MAKKVLKSQSDYHCRECRHSTDYHEKNHKGEFFMCKCKYHPFSKFLNYDYCEHFQLKK